MSTHNIYLKYRTQKRYPTIISIMPPGMTRIVTFRGSNYRCLEQIFMVPKGFVPSKFDCNIFCLSLLSEAGQIMLTIKSQLSHPSKIFITDHVKTELGDNCIQICYLGR